MSLTLITAPPALPVTEAEVWSHLRVALTVLSPPSEPVDKTHILALINAAVATIDGSAGWLGRCLVQQTWDLKLDYFPNHRNTEGGYQAAYFAGDAIRMPLSPLRSVTSITYVDTNGVSQTLSSSKYTVDTASEPGRIVPIYQETWPSTRGQIDAVTVRFVAGYAPGASASPPVDADYQLNVPPMIKAAIKLIVTDLYENRSDEEPVAITKLPNGVEALLSPLRVWDFF